MVLFLVLSPSAAATPAPNVIRELATGRYIERGDVLLLGPPTTGTHAETALAVQLRYFQTIQGSDSQGLAALPYGIPAHSMTAPMSPRHAWPAP